MAAGAPGDDLGEIRGGALRARVVLGAMVLVTSLSALVAMSVLYSAGLSAQRERLAELCHSQAELINAVASFDAVESKDANPAGPWVATLSQVAAGYSSDRAAPARVSFAIIGREGGRIVMHLQDGKLFAPHSRPLPPDISLEAAEAALTRQHGELEYASERRSWLVVHERIPALGMAVLSRLDLDSIKRPFRHALWISGFSALILVGLASALLRKTNVRTVQDLTRQLLLRKQAESELSRHRDDLERTVQQRTEELSRAHAQLVERARLATLGQITAKVSHELRNPLGTLRTSLYTLRERMGGESPDLARILERCDRNVTRCDRIIEELLSFTRPRMPQLRRQNVSELAREIVEEYRVPPPLTVNLAIESGVELVIDADDLRRMLINLLSNAVDAVVAEGSDPSIQLTLAREAGSVVIRVSDRGAGIPSDVLSKAFEPLFSTKGFGIGLGLPIVRELAERNHGSVELLSRGTEGTTATLRFPGTEDRS
ncbi:MAG TPA: HAMP domain-containing sensor histidine kinase [Polyangiaceae bacterium]|nr:HAMP domain-containing sensor histidine kinase [Polyangiaceae bacterium]